VDRPWFCAALASLCLLLCPAVPAQTKFHSATPTGPTAAPEGAPPAVVGSSIIVSVVDDAGMPLDVEAIVRLYDEARQTVSWGNTKARSEAQFDDVPAGQYEVEVSARGFKTTQQELTATSSHEAYHVTVALPVDVSGAAEDIQLGQVLAPKPRKEAEKGIAAMNAGKLQEAQKHFEAAYKLAPTNADVNYLLGVLAARQKNFDQAEKWLNRAISFDPRHAGALTELGNVLLHRGDIAGAVAVLEPAISLEPKRWRARQLLGEAYFREGQFEKALQQAEMAVRGSKGIAVDAWLLEAQALAKRGKRKEAVETLESLLREQPQSEAAPRARELIAMLENGAATNPADAQ
jgi:Flp pilus assembly protein TadD